MKKFILSLFVWFVWIISFCSADITFVNSSNLNSRTIPWSTSDYTFNVSIPWNSYYCFRPTYRWLTCTIVWYWLSFGWTNWDYCFFNSSTDNWTTVSLTCNNTDSRGNDLYRFWIPNIIQWWACPECPTCDPQYTSEQCQSVYWLVSSWLLNICENNYNNCQSDLNSCQSNTSWFNDQLNNCNLSLNACNSSLTNCLQYNCPEVDYTWDLQRSNIYINNILHPWRQFVNIEIPDYITWDYSVGDDDFNLYVWSGYDVDYIESVIDINSYRPTSDDFTNVFVSGLTLVMPYIVIVLFIIFVRKLLKRIFK